MRILFVGLDNPTIMTGYGRTCLYIGEGLAQKGHDVYSISGNLIVPVDITFHGIKVLKNKNDEMYPSKQAFLEYYELIKPDVCIFMNDAYRVRYLTELDKRILDKCMLWIPIEKRGVSDQITLSVCRAVKTFTVTEWAAKELSDRLGKKIECIPHQVDTDTFKPIDLPRRQLFTIIRTDKNQPRKMWEKTFEVYRQFSKGKTDVNFIAKTDPNDVTGEDLTKYTKGLFVEFIDHDVSAERLNILYNTCHVFLSTTGAEGFGLSLAEAMSSGLPVIATNTKPIDEVLDNGSAGGLIDVKGEIWNQRLNTMNDEIDVDHAVKLLETAYEDWNKGSSLTEHISRHNREYIVSKYSLRKIVNKWDEEIRKTVKESDRICVGIVTKNRHQYLTTLLTSLLYQTYKNFDVIIIDNGDDESITQDRMLNSILTRLYADGHIWNIKRGSPIVNCPESHQKILDTANNDFIVKLDDDLLLEPDYLEQLIGTIKTDPNIAAVGGLFLKPDKHKKDQLGPNVKPIITNLQDNYQWYYQDEVVDAEHLYSSFLYRRKYMKETNFPNNLSQIAFREETLTTYRLFKNKHRLVINPKAICYHFSNSSGGVRDTNFDKGIKMAQQDGLIFQKELEGEKT